MVVDTLGGPPTVFDSSQPGVRNAIKGGNLYIDAIRLTQEVDAGQPIEIEVDVSNGAVSIMPDDPDSCSNNANPCVGGGVGDTVGYCAALTITPKWAGIGDTETQCIRTAFIGVGTHTFTKSIIAPASGGEFEIDFTLAGSGSNEQTTVTETVTVRGDGGGNGGGGNGGNGDGNGDTIAGLPTSWVVAGGGVALGVGLIAAAELKDRRP